MAYVDDIGEDLVLIDPVTGWRIDSRRVVVRRIRSGAILSVLALLTAFFFGACLFFIGLRPWAAVVTIVAVGAIGLAVSPVIARIVSREPKRHSRRH